MSPEQLLRRFLEPKRDESRGWLPRLVGPCGADSCTATDLGLDDLAEAAHEELGAELGLVPRPAPEQLEANRAFECFANHLAELGRDLVR